MGGCRPLCLRWGGHFPGTEGSVVQFGLGSTESEKAVMVTLVARSWSSRPLDSVSGRVGEWQGQYTDVREKHGKAKNSRGSSVSAPSKADSNGLRLGTCQHRGSRIQDRRLDRVHGRGRRLAHGAAPHSCPPGWVPTHRAGWNQVAGWKGSKTALHGLPRPQVQ